MRDARKKAAQFLHRAIAEQERVPFRAKDAERLLDAILDAVEERATEEAEKEAEFLEDLGNLTDPNQ